MVEDTNEPRAWTPPEDSPDSITFKTHSTANVVMPDGSLDVAHSYLTTQVEQHGEGDYRLRHISWTDSAQHTPHIAHEMLEGFHDHHETLHEARAALAAGVSDFHDAAEEHHQAGLEHQREAERGERAFDPDAAYEAHLDRLVGVDYGDHLAELPLMALFAENDSIFTLELAVREPVPIDHNEELGGGFATDYVTSSVSQHGPDDYRINYLYWSQTTPYDPELMQPEPVISHEFTDDSRTFPTRETAQTAIELAGDLSTRMAEGTRIDPDSVRYPTRNTERGATLSPLERLEHWQRLTSEAEQRGARVEPADGEQRSRTQGRTR